MTWYAKPKDPYDKRSTEGTSNILEMRDILRNDFQWTDEAITGAVANSIYEGGLNPWRWGGDQYPPTTPGLRGCGLFGFDPYTRYLTLPGSEYMNLSVTEVTPNARADVGSQQVTIMANGTWGWVSNCWRTYWDSSIYTQEYAQRTQVLNTYGDGNTLTEQQYGAINNIYDAVFAFLACFEGPATPNYEARKSVADDVYDIITGHPPTPPTPTTRKKMPVYMMIRKFI